MAPSRQPLIVFDGDDTLWETERLYDEARDAAAAVVAEAGLSAEAWTTLQRRIDVANVADHGLTTARFPRSCVEAYERVAHDAGTPVDPAVAERVRRAAASVFTAQAVVRPDAEATLVALVATHRLALLTQGDAEVQGRRIDASGLRPRFDRVDIVPAKTADVLGRLLAELQADPASSWFVGNSVPSDVMPARACGMRAVWVDAPVWEHERRESPPEGDPLVFTAASLAEVPGIIARVEAG